MRIMTGNDKSYRRATLRSVITPILLDPRSGHCPQRPFADSFHPNCTAWLSTSSLIPLILGDNTGIAGFALWQNWPGTYRPPGPYLNGYEVSRSICRLETRNSE